jgi:hypothetical protein
MLQATAVLWTVLTPVQFAHLAVGCPAPVNMLQLADMLAVATGQPSAQAVLAELATHLAGGCSADAPFKVLEEYPPPGHGYKGCAAEAQNNGVKGQVPIWRFPQSPAQLSVHPQKRCPQLQCLPQVLQKPRRQCPPSCSTDSTMHTLLVPAQVVAPPALKQGRRSQSGGKSPACWRCAAAEETLRTSAQPRARRGVGQCCKWQGGGLGHEGGCAIAAKDDAAADGNRVRGRTTATSRSSCCMLGQQK